MQICRVFLVLNGFVENFGYAHLLLAPVFFNQPCGLGHQFSTFFGDVLFGQHFGLSSAT